MTGTLRRPDRRRNRPRIATTRPVTTTCTASAPTADAGVRRFPVGEFSAAGRSSHPREGGETTYPRAGSRTSTAPNIRRRSLDLPEYRGVRGAPRPRPARPGPCRRRRSQQLVVSDTVDWFPHLSPDGNTPPTSASQPAPSDTPPTSTSRSTSWHQRLEARARALIPLFGGQGTLNVNSWSPDGRRFAYIAYPVGDRG